MKKLLFIFLLFVPLFAFAEINECKTDVYFANGILTSPEEAFSHAEIVLKPAIIDLLGPETFAQTIGKVDYAYNETMGEIWDATETVLQKFGWVWFGGVVIVKRNPKMYQYAEQICTTSQHLFIE
jgi:DNA modification methylase